MEWLTKIMAIVSTNQMRTMMRIYECPLIVTTCSPRHWHQWCCPRQGLLMIRLGCYWCNARLSRYDKWEDWLGVTFGTTGSAQCSRVIIIFSLFYTDYYTWCTWRCCLCRRPVSVSMPRAASSPLIEMGSCCSRLRRRERGHAICACCTIDASQARFKASSIRQLWNSWPSLSNVEPACALNVEACLKSHC